VAFQKIPLYPQAVFERFQAEGLLQARDQPALT